jgi:cytochrome P450
MTPTQDLDVLVRQWDMYDPEHEKLRWDVLGHARRHCPVPWTDGAGGFYLVTRYEDVRQVLSDWEDFSSTEGLPTPMPIRLCPIDADPPLHTDLRALLNPLFSRSYLRRYEPMIRATAARLVEQWAPRGEVELIGEFAAPFVGLVLMQIVMGDMEPEQRAGIRTNPMTRSPSATRWSSVILVVSRTEAIFAQSSRNPWWPW